MRESKEISECKSLFYVLGRGDKLSLLKNSNLDNRERRVLYMKHIQGLSAKEISNELQISIDAYNKMQQRIYKKFYIWLKLIDLSKFDL